MFFVWVSAHNLNLVATQDLFTEKMFNVQLEAHTYMLAENKKYIVCEYWWENVSVVECEHSGIA